MVFIEYDEHSTDAGRLASRGVSRLSGRILPGSTALDAENWPHPESLVALSALKIRKTRHSRRVLWFYRLILISIGVPLLALLAEFQRLIFPAENLSFVLFAIFFVGILFLGLFGMARSKADSKRLIHEAEYHALPHAIDGTASHRCIFCGNGRIYQHAVYADELAHFDCARCRRPLYVE